MRIRQIWTNFPGKVQFCHIFDNNFKKKKNKHFGKLKCQRRGLFGDCQKLVGYHYSKKKKKKESLGKSELKKWGQCDYASLSPISIECPLENTLQLSWFCWKSWILASSQDALWDNHTRSVRIVTMSWFPGGTHIFGRTGMYRSNGSLFYKKSLNMGPVFYPKILKNGSTFLTEPQIKWFSGVFAMRKPRKIAKFWKIGLFLKENP